MKSSKVKSSMMNALYLSGVIGFAALPAFVQAAENTPAIKALLDQAAYWHEKAHNDLATSALQKILMVDPNNVDALYLMSLYASENGNKDEALEWRNKLTAASPQDPRLQSLDNAKVMQSISPSQLATARQFASQGNIPKAIESYQNVFNGNKPLDNLAVEYYLTMAGDPTTLPMAISGLQQRVAQLPNDTAARVALGKALTYQQATRRDGIAMLESMAASNREADAALRQALLWITPQPADERLYQAYQQRHPDDQVLADYYKKNIGGAAKGQGYSQLNSGDLASAKTQFESVLAINPNDGDALAGLGFIALRSGDFANAENYLNQAAKQGGANSAQLATQAQDAHFYGELDKAKKALASGNIDSALALSAPLAQATGDKGTSVALFRADLLRRKGDLSGTEQAYRNILAQNPQNNDAKLGLYYVLQQQKQDAQAQQVLQTVPSNLRPAAAPAGINVDPIRREAALALQRNDPQGALNLLQQALAKQPSNIWVRLDMARILQQQGNAAQAQSLMAEAAMPGAPADNLYAAALFAAENKDWSPSHRLLNQIPPARQTKEIRALSDRVEFNQKMATADAYLANGDSANAAIILRGLAQNPPSAPSDVGNLAKDLMAAGDSTTAVNLVRKNISNGIHGKAGDYAAQISVLTQSGLTQEAEALLSNPAIQSSTSPIEISRLRMGTTINQADALREQGQYAAAYDKLIVALQNDPQNIDLMLAMGRLYQSGKMNDEAGKVYAYLLKRDPTNEGARVGAVNVALAKGDVQSARQLMLGMRGPRTPERLLLAARVAEAEGDHEQALALLRSAKGKMIGLEGADSVSGANIAGLQLVDNPFINQTTRTQARTGSLYGAVLPWQNAAGDGVVAGGVNNLAATASVAQSGTLKQVDQMMDSLQDKTASWAQGNISIRSRDGESGLSELTEAKAPLTFAGVPFDTSRLSFTVTPVSLNAGSTSGTGSNRFGTGALQQGLEVKNATEASALAATTSAAALAAATTAQLQAQTDRETACQGTGSATQACTDARLAENDANTAKQLAANNLITAQTFSPNDFTADSPGSQQESGVELALALAGEDYKADIGTTPLGQDMSSLIGGLQWAPKLGQFARLAMTAERRPVIDSLLSYVGATDRISGQKWGAVTKNGGGLNLSYDDGDAGLYAGVNYYSYFGDNVKSNNAITSSVGAYIRPYRYDDRELKTGVNISYMNFSKNLSYFSFGQGGYFSPQDYVSVSFPVEYSQHYGNWNYKLGGAVGYQSYSQDESKYFPNNPALQAQLEQYVRDGYSTESSYAAQSKNGIGYNFKADGSYNLQKNMQIGGQVGYDTFGDYSETTALIYFRYLLDGK
ncbi:cellulose biosynthesis protein BcsC [Yersinia frederiksenii]|uniref:cellulose biosynthesis protein BcsC n=1 Tax=Yersinia frederiksenii TaxID=29484 RepID=UPI0005E06A47|nr:cellulose biosynthesis protein BcsC [Yersinia frederiksenii]CNK99838.1 cellulose synthase subunit BcsC [Yersinia frederiksenii]